MTATGQDVVAAARRWIGTPWRHQHRLHGFGVDCVGLVCAAGMEAGVLEDPAGNFAPWRGYGRLPNPTKMRAGLEAFLRPLGDEAPADGDVMWIAWREAPHLPMHLAIKATWQGRPTIIHAAQLIGQVVEHGFTGEWPDLVHSWYRFPKL